MIEVGWAELFLVPLVFYLFILGVCHVYYSAVRVARRARSRPNRLYRCQVCRHVYEDARDVPLARCPRCGCLNEAVRR